MEGRGGEEGTAPVTHIPESTPDMYHIVVVIRKPHISIFMGFHILSILIPINCLYVCAPYEGI